MADVSLTSSPVANPTSHGALQAKPSNVAVADATSPQIKILDIAKVTPTTAVTVIVPESEEEFRHRLDKAAKDANERRVQERVVTVMMAGTYLTLFLLALYFAIRGNTDQQKWGFSGLTTTLGAVLGFLVGRKN